jgi:hypothetical protein
VNGGAQLKPLPHITESVILTIFLISSTGVVFIPVGRSRLITSNIFLSVGFFDYNIGTKEIVR